MAGNQQDSERYEVLAVRLRSLLPEMYQDNYDTVRPVSMGSAGLRYAADGKVAWDEMWGSFCDLAMAGGPPHRGTVLEPGMKADIELRSPSYDVVVHEVCRGILMVTGLAAEAAPVLGWVRVYCTSAAMAAWLARAIVMENVSANSKGLVLHLPAGPDYRVEKEIKNVVTAMAKANHYWSDHMSWEQQQTVAHVLRTMEAESPVIQPLLATRDVNKGEDELSRRHIIESFQEETGASQEHLQMDGWVGVEMESAQAAIKIMRLLAASNVLARREGTVLFMPNDRATDTAGEELLKRLLIAYRLIGER